MRFFSKSSLEHIDVGSFNFTFQKDVSLFLLAGVSFFLLGVHRCLQVHKCTVLPQLRRKATFSASRARFVSINAGIFSSGIKKKKREEERKKKEKKKTQGKFGLVCSLQDRRVRRNVRTEILRSVSRYGGEGAG